VWEADNILFTEDIVCSEVCNILSNLARLEAGGANVHLATVTIDDDVDALDVGAELTVGDAVRVADGATGNGVLTANFANFGHN